MCKLNILCHEMDGKCNCGTGMVSLIENKPVNGILSAIVGFIQKQPDIWTSLVEDYSRIQQDTRIPVHGIDNDLTISEAVTFESTQGDYDQLYIRILIEPLKKLKVGRNYSFALEVTDAKFTKIMLEQPIYVTIAIEGKFDGDLKETLGEVQSVGTIFFPRVAVKKFYENVNITVKANRDEILPYVQDVKIIKKKREKMNLWDFDMQLM